LNVMFTCFTKPDRGIEIRVKLADVHDEGRSQQPMQGATRLCQASKLSKPSKTIGLQRRPCMAPLPGHCGDHGGTRGRPTQSEAVRCQKRVQRLVCWRVFLQHSERNGPWGNGHPRTPTTVTVLKEDHAPHLKNTPARTTFRQREEEWRAHEAAGKARVGDRACLRTGSRSM
jgi:hypothetical protein